MDEDLSLQLFTVLTRASRAVMDHAIQDIRRYSLNQTEFAVLELLYHKGPHPLQQIGDKILLASGSMTYVVDNLEKKGYLERKTGSSDRRITFANISDQGRALLDDIFPQHATVMKQAMQGLNPEEKAIAITLLRKLGKEARQQLSGK